MSTPKSLADLAAEALAVQDACNLSGVVHGFSRAMTRLWELLPELGTDDRNHHPICVLWADKIASLAGVQGSFGLSVEAYNACEALAKGSP